MKPKIEAEILPPLLFPAKSSTDKAWMKELKDKGKIRPIGPRIYSSLKASVLPNVVRTSWPEIVANLFPEAILSFRSALDFKPDSNGVIYLTGTTNRKVQYPGLTLEFIRGPEAEHDDPEFRGFRSSSLPRAFLENLAATKRTANRALKTEELEERLERELRVGGEARLNAIRDRARELAGKHDWQTEFKRLDQIIGALLGTMPTDDLRTQIGRARALGKPFDPACNAKLELLFAELKANPLAPLKDSYKAREHFRNKAFFEAYFSNYIEGTMFEIEEAEEIVFESKIPEKRPKDAHDILGTYQIVSDPNEIRRCPRSTEELIEVVRTRHKTLMSERDDVQPGEFKERPNKAGNTRFVDPEFIEGTFEKGFQKYLELPEGLARAVYIMFLVAEIHPFNDGNGRIARIMMNSELHSQGLVSIIIPTVFRDDYVSALKALSRRERPDPLVRMIQRAQKFSNLEFAPYNKILKSLEERNWFEEASEAKLIER